MAQSFVRFLDRPDDCSSCFDFISWVAVTAAAIHAFQDRLLPPLASDDDRPAGCGTVILRPAEEDEDEADDDEGIDYVGKEEEEAARQEWLGWWVEGKEV
jgi:regulator of RNase E activity RraB